jgi:hypothetical protein
MAPPAYPPQKNSARSGPREHSASLYTKCTRFDILAVLDTCTTVASRVATNACATHLRFLTKPQTPSGLASSPLRRQRGPGVVMTYNNRLSSTNHDSLRGNPGEHTEVDSQCYYTRALTYTPAKTKDPHCDLAFSTTVPPGVRFSLKLERFGWRRQVAGLVTRARVGEFCGPLSSATCAFISATRSVSCTNPAMCAPACAACSCPGLRLMQRGAVGWGRTHAHTQADVDTPKLVRVHTDSHARLGLEWAIDAGGRDGLLLLRATPCAGV